MANAITLTFGCGHEMTFPGKREFNQYIKSNDRIHVYYRDPGGDKTRKSVGVVCDKCPRMTTRIIPPAVLPQPHRPSW